MKCTHSLWLVFTALIALQCTHPSKQESQADPPLLSAKERMLLRADSFELDSKYKPPPGEALHHHTAGFAKILCSAVFITGLDADFAAENIGFFSSPYEERSKVVSRQIDHENKTVSLTLPDGVIRVAKYVPGHGCICLGKDDSLLHFTPKVVKPNLPNPSITEWPMGDQISVDFPSGLDRGKIRRQLRQPSLKRRV